MLKKLMKYEFLSMRKTALFVLLSIVAVSLLAMGLGFLLPPLFQSDAALAALLFIPLVLLYGGLILAQGVLAVVFLFLVIYRFFTTTFTDEGYLTLMLPVKRRTLLFSKELFAYLMALVTLILVFSSIALSLFPVAGDVLGDVLHELFFSETMKSAFGVLTTITTVLSIFVVSAAYVAVAYAAVTVGSTVMQKQKLLGSVLFGFIAVLLTNTLKNLTAFPLTLLMNDAASYELAFFLSSLVNLLLHAALAVGAHFLSEATLGKNLNLE